MVNIDLYKTLDNAYVKCNACIRECIIPPKTKGFCGNRKNNDGKIGESYSNIFIAEVSTLKSKPILYLKDSSKNIVPPETSVLSVGGYGCNLKCIECPNPQMSHPRRDTVSEFDRITIDQVIKQARTQNISYIALTYNEFIPYPRTVYELTKNAKDNNIETILITNTTFTKSFTDMFYDAGGRIMRLDIKADIVNGDEFYKNYCGLTIMEDDCSKTMKHICENILYSHKKGFHIEIMSAITPIGFTPGNFQCVGGIQKTAKWIAENLSKEVPWHLALLRPKNKWVDVQTNTTMLKFYVALAKEEGLLNVDIIDQMCDCRQEELFCQKGCCQ